MSRLNEFGMLSAESLSFVALAFSCPLNRARSQFCSLFIGSLNVKMVKNNVFLLEMEEMVISVQ
jgi:hypothetical protein